ncbi:MAG: hypothetical protein CM1200mP41_25260 [Gammaproteobacteria bacterium]|nr:MAG: hypothetical protein CM1200mP41_25260 [Gammaproteobacteria bacterium]
MARSCRGSFLSGVAIGHFTFGRSGHPFVFLSGVQSAKPYIILKVVTR